MRLTPADGLWPTQPRDIPLRSGRAALLFVDTQNFNCHRDGAVGSRLLVSGAVWRLQGLGTVVTLGGMPTAPWTAVQT
jgi:hypothetical protein